MARLTREKDEAALSGPPPSIPVMTGTHFHALDDKGRIIIPAKLRTALTDHFWMILNDKDNIDLYDYQTGLDILEHCERQMAEHPEDEDIAAAVERITGAAEEVMVESGWRVQVPDVLRFYAQLDKEIVTVGALNHAILWSRERWIEAQSQRQESAEVRRAQAGMLRAAASSIRKSQTPAESQREIVETREVGVEQADVAATGTGGIVGGVIGVNSGNSASGSSAGRAIVSREPDSTAIAPSGDGKRSSRVLTLSQLGR